MHRLILAGLVISLSGCVVPNTELRDQPQIERLRIQISKARNAISETRAAIAEARGAPHLEELYVRLGELMSDEAKYHYQVAYEREQRAGKALNVPQVKFLKEQAILVYELVLRRYPKSKLADRVLFNMGQECREIGNYKKMRTSLERLAQDYPNSPLRPDALLILGDDQFDRNKMDEAATYYKQIVEGPKGRMTGLGHFKLAWVYVNQAECKPALENFEKALIASEAYFGGPVQKGDQRESEGNLDVRREALVDLVYCYTHGDNEKKNALSGVPFLQKYAYNRGAYVAALSRLASRYSVQNNGAGAAIAARELLRLAPDSPERVEDAEMLYLALTMDRRRKKKDDSIPEIDKSKRYSQVGDDARLIARAFLRQIRKPTSAQETRDKQLSQLEERIRDLATEAQGVLVTLPKGPKRIAFAKQVARAYQTHVQTFPDHEQSTAMLSNLVDVLVEAGDSFNAGRRALQVAQRLQKGKTRTNAWYDAVVHLQTTLSKPSDRLSRVVSRAGLRKAGSGLLSGKQLPVAKARKVKFAMAKTDYDEGRFRSAIDRLNAIALEHPATEEGDSSVHLVLDSYRTINDFDGLIRAGLRFLKPEYGVTAKVRKEIKPIVDAAKQQALDELALAAAGVDGGDVTGDLEKYAKANEGSPLGERALINALLAARASGDSQNLYRLAGEIEKKYPKSKQLSAIYSTVGRTAYARFEFDQAIKYFGLAAGSGSARRVSLWVAEGQIRQQLADIIGARNAFERALKAADKPAAKNQAAVALASLLEQTGDHDRIISKLKPMEGEADSETLAYLGMAMIRRGDMDNGEAMLQRVLDSSAGASQDARARAFYGQAEAFYKILKNYQPEDDVESIQELVTLLEVTEQSYLKAARENSPVYTAAAFGRLADVSAKTAQRLKTIKLPSSLPAAARNSVKQAFNKKAIKLEQQAQQAIDACAEQAWVHKIFHPAVRICLKGEIPSRDPVTYDKLSARGAKKTSKASAGLRVRLSKNSEDLKAITALGEAMLTESDPHSARIIFSRAAQSGGGPIEANLLGIACLKSGDTAGALEAFARSAAGGLEAGRQNLAQALRKISMGKAAEAALKRFKSGGPGGRRL